MPHRIEIVDHDPRWSDEFAALATELRTALGPLALRIEHIGSTSVPGLAAKDVIDVQVTVAALSTDITHAMTGAGFAHRADVTADHVPPGVTAQPGDWEKLYFQNGPGARRAHIHVRVLGAPNERYPLLFRDYLRAHPASSAALAGIKRDQATRLPEHSASYYAFNETAYDRTWETATARSRQP